MQEKQKKTGLVWFKNNLRVHDNAILDKALSENHYVIAVYFFDPKHYLKSAFGFKKTEKYRAKFLIETVTDLKKNLKSNNIELFVYRQSPEDCISSMVNQFNISSIYTQTEWTSEESQTFTKVKKSLSDQVRLYSDYDQFLFHPDDISFEVFDIPNVFTHFRKQLEKYCNVRPLINSEKSCDVLKINNTTEIPALTDLGLSDFNDSPHSAFPFKGGESHANARLEYYVFKSEKIGVYKKTRNGLVGKDFSSKLSPWLANGSISARVIFWTVKQFEKEYFKNQSTYWLIFELIWRDYFKYISLKHQNHIFKLEGILNNNYTWNYDTTAITNWINGTTKSDFINANMNELRKTGWMSNRGRQNVASYFSKVLQLDWRIGASYFESLLLDYDVHSNYGNWMYVSGVGNDPRNRSFNVSLQAKRYDPKGIFQMLWLQKDLF